MQGIERLRFALHYTETKPREAFSDNVKYKTTILSTDKEWRNFLGITRSLLRLGDHSRNDQDFVKLPEQTIQSQHSLIYKE